VKAKESTVLGLVEFEGFLSRLADARAFDECYKIIDEMTNAGVAPSATAYGHALRAGRRALRIVEIREVFGSDLPKRNNPHSSAEDGAEVSGEAAPVKRSAVFERMKELRNTMNERGLELETWFWDDCASWLTSINHAGLLINLAIAMEARGISPSTHYYTKMIYTLPRCGFGDRADILFSRMVMNGIADLNVYITRLGSLVYMGRYEEAAQLFKEMESKFEVTEVAYNTIIHGYLSAKQLEKALEVFERMKTNPNAQPTGVTACTFLVFFHESGRLEHARAILDYFKHAIGFPSTSNERANLLKFYARYDCGQAVRLLSELVKAEPNYDIHVYNAVYSMLCDRHIAPDWKRSIGETCLDKSYPLKAGGVAELCSSLSFHVRHMVGRMEAYSVQPTATTYEILMRQLLARKDYPAVQKLYETIDVPHSTLYSSHRNAYLASLVLGGNSAEQIQAFLVKMRTRRWPISSVNSRRLAEKGISIPPGSFVYGSNNMPVPH
jgi:pentatricopeptide repeat protein